MRENLPPILDKYVDPLPLSRQEQSISQTIDELTKLYGEEYINSHIWTRGEAEKVLSEMAVEKGTPFYSFYLHSFEEPDEYRSEDLYGLIEIYDDFKKPFWTELPNTTLRLSSIEGEYSLFYDIKNDLVYGVDWGDMKELIKGNFTPKFDSFYDFLNWYFSDAEE